MIYCGYLDQHEGYLTRVRVDIICNSFLTNQCRKLDLLQYLRAHSLSSGKQELLFSPPGRLFNCKSNHLVNVETNDNHSFSLWNVNVLKPFNPSINNEIINKNKRSIKHFTADVKAKRIADLLEALIGGFHEAGGINCAIGAIRAFGLWATPCFE